MKEMIAARHQWKESFKKDKKLKFHLKYSAYILQRNVLHK